MMPAPRVCLVLLLAIATACLPSSQATTPASPVPCASEARVPEPGPSDAPESEAPAIASLQSTPRSAALRPGRYWYRNGECSALDVRIVRRGEAELTEFAMHVRGGVHTSPGIVFYLARERVLAGGGFRQAGLSLDLGCNAPHTEPAVSSGAFGGVPLFDDWESCEAQACAEDSCIARFDLGDCSAAVATSARRLRQVSSADDASRQRTLMRFQRLGRRARLWRADRDGCVAVQAEREGAELELRYSEAVEGGRTDTTEKYSVAPLDLRAALHSYTTIFTPGGGGLGGIGSASGSGLPLYFGDGVIVLGTTDLFFRRADCEANLAPPP